MNMLSDGLRGLFDAAGGQSELAVNRDIFCSNLQFCSRSAETLRMVMGVTLPGRLHWR
jgi:hypothetical protein